MERLSYATFIDQLFCECDGWNPTVVEPDHVRDTRFFHRFRHLDRFGDIHRERFFTQYPLTRFCRGHGNISMEMVGHADVYGIDVVSFDERSPVGLDRGVAPVVGKLLCDLLIPRTQRLENWSGLQVKEPIDLLVGVGMRLSHESVSDHADPEILHRISSFTP